jgi:hypothetical protein
MGSTFLVLIKQRVLPFVTQIQNFEIYKLVFGNLVRFILTKRCSLTTEGKNKGQVRKGLRWMPWHQRAKKDAAGCEKPRGAASEHRSVGIRMGQPIPIKIGISYAE